jgi:hypothetical protein
MCAITSADGRFNSSTPVPSPTRISRKVSSCWADLREDLHGEILLQTPTNVSCPQATFLETASRCCIDANKLHQHALPRKRDRAGLLLWEFLLYHSIVAIHSYDLPAIAQFAEFSSNASSFTLQSCPQLSRTSTVSISAFRPLSISFQLCLLQLIQDHVSMFQ